MSFSLWLLLAFGGLVLVVILAIGLFTAREHLRAEDRTEDD